MMITTRRIPTARRWLALGIWGIATAALTAEPNARGLPRDNGRPPENGGPAVGSTPAGAALPPGAVLRTASPMRHGSIVDTVALSPDGGRVASASVQDRTASVWDARTGSELLLLGGFTWSIADLQFAPNGRWIAGATNDSGVVIWDAADGTKLAHLGRETRSGCGFLGFSGDSRRLASDGQLGRIDVWNARTWELERTIANPSRNVTACALSPDGRYVAGGDEECWVRVWALETGELAHEEQIAENPVGEDGPEGWGVSAVAFSPDGSTLVAAAHGVGLLGVHFWSTGTWGRLPRVVDPDAEVRGLAFSLDGRVLATLGRRVCLWSLTTGESAGEIPVIAQCFDLSADGQTVATGGSDFNVRTWSSSGKQIVGGESSAWDGLVAVEFAAEGRTIAGATGTGRIDYWDIASGKRIRTLDVGIKGSFAMAFSHDGSTIAAKSVQGELRIVDAESGEPRATNLDAGRTALPVIFSPNGGHVAWGTDGGRIRVADAATATVVLEIQSPERFTSLAFSPTGEIVAGGRSLTRFWDAASGKETRTIGDETYRMGGMALSADGRRLASWSFVEPRIVLWDVPTGEVTGELLGAPEHVRSLALSGDGKYLAAAGYAGAVSLWDLGRGGPPMRPTGNRGFVRAVRFSPDSRLLCAGDQSGCIVVWDLERLARDGSL